MEDIRLRSRWFKLLATVVLAVLILVLGTDIVMSLRADRVEASLRWTLPYRLPMIFYIAAVWMMRRAFAELERGALFDRVLPTLLTQVGFALGAGATASVFFKPWLWKLLCGPGRGAYASFDPPAITVGLVGLLLVVLARLFVRANAMQRDLDSIL